METGGNAPMATSVVIESEMTPRHSKSIEMQDKKSRKILPFVPDQSSKDTINFPRSVKLRAF